MKKNWKMRQLLLSLYMVAAVVVSAGCSANKQAESAESKKQTATTETQVNKKENKNTRVSFQKDLKKLKQRYKKNPNDKSNLLKYARTNYSLGNFNKAEKLVLPLIKDKNPDPEAMLLAAEINYVNGKYSESESYYNALLKDHKKTHGMQAEAGLQMVYYQTGQFNKAKDLFTDQKDLENPILDMMKAFEDAKPYDIDWDGKTSTTIPFAKSGAGVYVPIEVNGVKMNAFVDTGADGLTIDQEKASELGIESVSETEGQFAGGKTSKIGFGRTDKLKLGAVDIKNVPTMLGSFEAWKDDPNFQEAGNVHAVIGTNVLKQFIPTIDYLGKELTLAQRSEAGRTKMEEQQKDDQLEAKVPFTLSGTHYIHGKGTINNSKNLNMFVDSGFITESGPGINLSKETMDFTNIPLPKLEKPKVAGMGGGDFKEGYFDVDSYGFDDLKIDEAPGLYETGDVLSGMVDVTGFVTDAMLGENYLKQYKWTLDFDEMTMNFRK